MAGYFFHLYNFILDVEKHKDKIKTIVITNTANACKDFSNIRISVIPVKTKRYLYLYSNIFINGLNKDEGIEWDELNREYDNICNIAPQWDDYYKFEYSNFETMVYSAFDIYDDLIDVFKRQQIDISIKIDILGCNTRDEAIDIATSLDINNLFKERSTHRYIKDKIEKIDDRFLRIFERHELIENTIKNQKKAYILSKLIDNKTTRNKYKDNPDLIEAYDAYIDVKKLLSENKYS